MASTLVVQPHQDGRWRVLSSAGVELAAPSGRASATTWAIGYLHENGGGSYRMRLPDGTLGAAVPVSGRVGSSPERSGPAEPPRGDRRSGPAEPARGDRDDWQEPVTQAGELADQMLGRHDTADPSDAITGIEITSTNKTVRLLNAHVSIFAAWAALVAFVFAGGTVSGVITPALKATSSKATVGSYVTFGNAFLATVSLSACTALIWYLLRAGKIRSYGSVAAVLVGCLVIIYLCYQAGLYGPSPETVVTAINEAPGDPPSKLATVFEQFQAFYGWPAFLLGIGAGGIAGNIGYHIAVAENRSA